MVEILSMSVAGIVEMDVWIDPTGQHEESLGVEHLVIARQALFHFDDPAVLDADI